MDNFSEYPGGIRKKLAANFDFTENFEINSLKFDFSASFNSKNTKYAISKEIKVYEFETNEHFLFNLSQNISVSSIINEINTIKESIREIVRPHSDHMSSQILLVHVLEDEIPQDLERLARKTKYQKGFAFGFKGWADLGLVVISLKSNRVVTHKKFSKTAAFFKPEQAV
ncbi:MAG: hypothetical protein PQJ58_01200 [Spirochaetales bacterium]|nr:hypothetical protein [Spirochaetales bacterium]